MEVSIHTVTMYIINYVSVAEKGGRYVDLSEFNGE